MTDDELRAHIAALGAIMGIADEDEASRVAVGIIAEQMDWPHKKAKAFYEIHRRAGDREFGHMSDEQLIAYIEARDIDLLEYEWREEN